MARRIKVGVLFNARANLFEDYLGWIINLYNKNGDFELAGVHTNDKEFYKNKIFKDIVIEKRFDKIIENSDIVFSLGYWKIIKKEIIEKVPMGIVNFHNSYNLKYKGRNCSTHVIKNGEIFHGSTMHFIDEKVDEGKIIDTRKFLIKNRDTAEDIFIKATSIGLEILKENFYNVINQKIKHVKKIHNKDTYTYKKLDICHEIQKKFLNSEVELLREIRSLTFDKMAAPYIVLDGVKVYLKIETHDSGFLHKE